MTGRRWLAAVLIAVQTLDLATYLVAPRLEANPLMGGIPPAAVVVVKLAVVWLVLAYGRIGTPGRAELGLALAIAMGAFGAGTNVASLVARAAG